MAAYASLTSLMHILEQIQNHPRPPMTIDRQQIESLCENISFLKDFLENYSHEGGCSEAQGQLEIQIADAAYAVEDVIESHIVDQILAKESSDYNLFNQNLQKVVEDMNLIKKVVMEIQEKNRGINDDLLPTNIISMSANIIGSSTVPSPPTRKNTNTMVGFDDVLKEIMDRLIGYPTNLQILPIVGMGGIGKTTLARNAYDHPYIMNQFDVRVWVTFSQEYKLRDILLGALFCVTKTESDENLADFSDKFSQTSGDEIGRQLYQSLYGRRYLVIMDDMWSIEAWEKAKFFFPDGDNGSRIVITTRLSNVADHFDPNGFRMNFLDEDKSWDLFCKTVFQQDQCCPPELEENGKKIARNCKGLPLSIVVIGGLLANMEKTLEKWEYVAKNLNSIVNLENDEQCLKILSLSYNNLPVHLKPCFLYMGVFPEDEDIRVSWLVKLWVAEGFLKPIKAKSLEVVAEYYLNELIHRNLILVHKWGSSGKIKFCKIHDVLRDLCLREAKKEKFLCIKMADNLYTPEGKHCLRRIITHQSPLKENYNQALPSEPQTRSLICDSNGVLPSLISRLLRVFKAVDKYSYVEAKGDYRYPLENVFQLVNSRFLAFRTGWNSNSRRNGRNSNSIFPSSIHLLWNLQTLIVRDAWKNQTVAPPEIWEMSQLRHVEFELLRLPNPPNLPIHDQGDGFVLRKLQTLMGIKNLKLSEEVMKRIPNVKKLQVIYEDYPEGWSRVYCLNNFGCLNKLESLTCIFLSEKKPNHRIELLQNLAFPHSLKKLTLYDSCLLWEDLTRIGSLPHLQVLKLDFNSFHGPEWNPVEGEFQCLKFLLIVGCNGLRYWNADSTHFPRLEHLVLQKLLQLKEIPSDIGEIPTLQSIELEHCSDSAVISAKNIVEEQENLGNVGLHVRVRLLSKSELASLALENDLNFQVET